MSSLQDIYIKLDGIDGESKDSKHKDWIDVVSISLGASQSSSVFTGGGAGVGKANFDYFSFTHLIDKSSPNLFMYCAGGKHIKEVIASCCKVGDGSQEYMRVTMNDVIITDLVITNENVEFLPKETVSMTYSRIRTEVKEQKADGSMSATVTGAWDVKENKKV